MKKISIKYLLFFSAIGFQLFSQYYLWPTNASNYLTSSFCEYRPGHYHSAIDIKTWNKEGYPIYAVEDGMIYRILVSPYGYGKGIYLKLKDGNFAVYGHLQKFTRTLDKQIREKQLANQKYRLNWYPKNMLIKKGEIIGYTGSTGIGTPHLHFEIRPAARSAFKWCDMPGCAVLNIWQSSVTPNDSFFKALSTFSLKPSAVALQNAVSSVEVKGRRG